MNDSVAYLSASELIAGYRSRQLSPVEVARATLERIDRLNPKLNAFTVTTPERALDQAAMAERAYAAGTAAPLAGVPVSIKDLTPTQGIRTARGSLVDPEWMPDFDAPVVERVYAAGAVMLGKTNTPELGWKGDSGNRVFGPSYNPWRLERTPGGSSGGAAAAVAAGLGPLAQGSDGAGSVRIPASFCGIFGLKPSFGRVPSYPSFRGWRGVGVTGPMTRTVRDAAAMLDVMAGPDDRDQQSLPGRPAEPYLAACDAGIAGLSVAWSPDLGHAVVDPDVADLCGRAAERFESLGCHVEVVTPSWDDPAEIFRVMGAAENFAAWGHLLDEEPASIDKSFAAVLRFGRTVTIEQYLDAAHRRDLFWTEVQRFLARFDLLITPTVAVPPFPVGRPGVKEIDGREVGPLGWLAFTFPFNLTGQPAASVPVGFTSAGLPVGLQIVGRRHADATVLAASAAYEAAEPWSSRRPDLG